MRTLWLRINRLSCRDDDMLSVRQYFAGVDASLKFCRASIEQVSGVIFIGIGPACN
jgi:hypothetical protein